MYEKSEDHIREFCNRDVLLRCNVIARVRLAARRDESFDYRKTYDFYSQRKAIYKIGGPAL
jgi:hypothetical protein